MRRGIVAGAIGLVLLVGALLVVPNPLRSRAQPGGPRVVASTTVLADLVRQVGDGRIADVSSAVPAGIDVEDYNPTPADLRTVSSASLLVMNGLALDRWRPSSSNRPILACPRSS